MGGGQPCNKKQPVAECVGQNGTWTSREGILGHGTIWRTTVLARPIMSFSLWTMDSRGIPPRWNEWLPPPHGQLHAVFGRKYWNSRRPMVGGNPQILQWKRKVLVGDIGHGQLWGEASNRRGHPLVRHNAPPDDVILFES